ncbi:MAG: hypothetical protein MUC64_12710 [Rubritepida sp.]|nr:hypothetical protein [Rubritepida sp.]
MQQAVNYSQRASTLLAIAKALSDPYQSLTPQQEAALAELIPGYVKGGEVGLPSAPAGDVRGKNALLRTNWFNGRYLTAEALRRQDVYNDMRDRLGAHAQMPGVAWGLGVHPADGQNALPVVAKDGEGAPREGGMAKWMRITLRPGLAFDHVGRPILVSQAFDFTLEDLIGPARSTPRRVVPGGTEFAPCVCLAPDPEGPSGGSAMLRPGPWLLVIEPGETAEGQAKVMGEACAGPSTANCQAESWRGGFGLSLVRVPIELPDGPGLDTAWALRGTMSAWWFDVFEHSLVTRWDPTFATDAGFWRGVGPGRQEAGAVALAMVWLGTDGSAIFLDPWIPRRSIVATPGEDWHRARFGAPPRAAAWARIHQFQAMLAESLRSEPLMGGANAKQPLNLWQRGFRHIPPIGFLPLDPAAIGERLSQGDGGTTGIAMLDRIVAAGGGRIAFVSGMIAQARRQIARYFEGTTVLAYGVVALHDDDILEDLSNVFDKDPVRVAERGANTWRPVPGRDGVQAKDSPARAFLDQMARLFDLLGLDELVNRRTEIVKVILPLQGLSREHPVLGILPADARGQAADWLGSQPPSWWLAAAQQSQNAEMSRLQTPMPLDMLPRHFGVYVKQRMVLLDVLVLLLELIEAVVTLVRDVDRTALQQSQQQNMTAEQPMYTTQSYALAYQQQPAEKRALAEAALAEPLVQRAVAQAAVLAVPELRVPERNAAFTRAVAEREATLAATITDPVQRQQAALAQVSDSYAAEHRGFEVMQVLAAVQPPAQAKAMIAEIGTAGAASPLRDSLTGVRVTTTVADSVTAEGPRVFETSEAALAYGEMRRAVAEQQASAFLVEAPAGVTAKEILAKPPEEAARLLGSEEKLAAFTEAFRKETVKAAEAAEAVAAAPPSPEMAEALVKAVEAGQDPEVAIARAKLTVAGDAQKTAALDGAATMVKTLGAQRTLTLARTLQRPKG